MNCKPGNLAYITRLPAGQCCRTQLMGAVVRVTQLKRLDPPLWAMEKPLVLHVDFGFFELKIHLTAIEDEYLTPIDGVPVEEEQTDEVTA
ncbi:hypothetical protein [Ralstonia holmesii]|uniref:hypothetical protein n=1 Tax=Ralstonia holmesii TaxID=3058602 RepID=UPI0028F510C6|nr:hypothetical protein [Ralstonia sp. LMG 32967]CAJ0698746.1 hypothetical protein R11007_02875 [Ralstonia sp. LMG 32967]